MSLFVTISLIPILVRFALKFQLVDVPDARKVHAAPIPRCGGIAISLGACIPIIIGRYTEGFIGAYLAGVGVLFIIGILDDRWGLDYRIKFSGQILAAAIVAHYGGLRILSVGCLLPESICLSGWASILITVVAIVGVTNAINLSDGLDGLAGGLCLMSFCCIGYLAYLVENVIIVLTSLSLAGAIFGFLRFNTFPATLFMGDTGSMFLGFSIATLSLAITQGATPYSPLLPLIIVGFPVMDTVVVMAERIFHGRSPFVADRNHFHHKLLRMGIFHSESVMVIYGIQGLLVTSAVVFRFYDDEFLLTLYLMMFALVLCNFFCVERKDWRFRRSDFMDNAVKGRLKVLKEQGVFIKIVFWPLDKGLPLLLLLAGLIPAAIHPVLPILSTVLLGILAITRIFRKNWLRPILSLTLYLFIPFVVYAGVESQSSWIDGGFLKWLYQLSFLGLVFFVMATLKLTHRKMGFKISPMDFLILFIVLVLPFVTGTYVEQKLMADFVSKTLMLFFSYEVLMGELRGQYGWLAVWTGAALVVVIIRGGVG
jgi:UDP-GlcNAc:undecaprenyl-phosphate/decaprenyl-phosphate GlcNAc-1-phosphate transferase